MSAENETKSSIGTKMLVVLVIATAVEVSGYKYVQRAAAQETTAETVSTGDAAAGEATFKRCAQCHDITNGDEVIVPSGNNYGANLYGVIGRAAGTVDGYQYYSKYMIAAGEAGLVWDEENLAEYINDPTAFLRSFLDDSSASTNMKYKLRFDQEHISAYLASFTAE